MAKTIILNVDLCAGCGACTVACMDQNDIYPEKGQSAWRRIHQIEGKAFPEARIQYISASCLHCQDSPCAIACPVGAISKDVETGTVQVAKELCIGCHSCALACPFGVPRYDQDEKMNKCNLCIDRVKAELEPACVRVCPLGALKFACPNDMQNEEESRYVRKLASAL